MKKIGVLKPRKYAVQGRRVLMLKKDKLYSMYSKDRN